MHTRICSIRVRSRRLRQVLVVAALTAVSPLLASTARAQGPTVDGALPTPLPLFPVDNWWNVDVSQAPLDPNSQSFITFIGGAGRRLHPDWGGSADDDDDPNAIYGIPYIVVPGTQPLVQVTFDYDDESDYAAPGRPPGYPIPEQAKTMAGWYEGGGPGNDTSNLDSANGDRHMLLADRDNKILYELYALHWSNTRGRWEAGSGAIFPLTNNHRRPNTWTSADAAGLAILPGLVRYDEAFGTAPINHAFRVTMSSTNGYVFPASHRAGGTQGALPMGARLRMKASVNISSYPAHLQRVFQAMKTYGLIVADNGSNMFITGTSDPRWEAQMGSWVSTFHALNAGMFEVVQLGWVPTEPPDYDSDGLPTSWETRFGLNPNSSEGNDGPNGDPDQDGQTNAQERAAGTHPNGTHKRYFAEGVSNAFFSTRIAAMNPGSAEAHVQFRFLRSDGVVLTHAVTIGARSRITLDPASVEGLAQADYSTVIDSDQVVVADRTVSWDATGYGAHTESSIAEPSRTWYLAEGSTAWDFTVFYLLQNPNANATTVTIRYLLPSGAPITKSYSLPGNSRTTINVDQQDPALADADVSAEITSTDPIIAERAMYLNRPNQPFAAGHGSAGVAHASTNWFLAEGATGPFFDLFILIENPNPLAAAVTATYLLPNGSTLAKSYNVPANSRFTIYVDNEDFPGAGKALSNVAVSTRLTSTNDVPIIVERTMWWPDGGWYEAHNSAGATETGTRWALAEGEVGGSRNASTFILIANTSGQAGSARVTLLYEGGGEDVRTYALPPNSRTNVAVGGDFPNSANRKFAALIESLGTASPAAIVVERAMYTDVGGVQWAAGTNAGATKLQ
jgi:hypothetical protein